VPTLLGVTLLTFALIHLIPGDPALLIAGDDAPPEAIVDIRAAYGLDRSLQVQYLVYLQNLARGHLGVSIRSGRPVLEEIAPRFVNTLALAVAAVLLTIAAGIPLGVLAATWRGTGLDRLGMLVALCGIATPVFWLGVLLMLLFSVKLRWLPFGGAGSWQHLVMPALALSTVAVPIIVQVTRASLLEALRQDFVRTARSKGLPEPQVLLKHALRNAAIPVMTVMGLRLGFIVGGAIVTETVFSYPGLGRLTVQAVNYRDFPVIQAVLVIISSAIVTINLMLDCLYGFIDPRVRS
jgi:ABC-type dipeptide/oligopeptide/nickel transport system permease component